MEFYENRSKRPFIVFVWIAKTQMSDEQLKDVGLSRYDV
ncbi:DUF1127 domain-containing protein [Enterobacter cloacae complex sp. 2DZ2F20B]|nr:DUF1127 domain-containing protein [Enterobacter cloacae complex sp. 2DZ2F20B]RYA73970.1 DUF1127 domain-containing protein [Enterobacter cloacae complex sp. 2DZ2F20B]